MSVRSDMRCINQCMNIQFTDGAVILIGVHHTTAEVLLMQANFADPFGVGFRRTRVVKRVLRVAQRTIQEDVNVAFDRIIAL